MNRRTLALALCLVSLASPLGATWSLVVGNRRTGEVGLAAATCVIADNLKRGLTCIVVGKGGGANQYAGTPTNVVAMGAGLRAGLSPAEVMELVLANEPFDNNLQAGIVSLESGPPVTFTGGNVDPGLDTVTGEVGDLVYAIQGNSLTGPEVIAAAEAALLAAEGDLGQKLLAAMQAARELGGDGRCSCSFGMPTSCGVPPPSFTKSAHIGILTVARIGDPEPRCTTLSNCIDGDFHLFLNVRGVDGLADDPDPVLQLQNRYDDWRAERLGRPDGLLSRVDVVDSMPADGTTVEKVVVQLVDIDGNPLTTGGADVRVDAADGGRRFCRLSPVTDHGDGTYSFSVYSGRVPGTDVLAISASDDLVQATLYPYLEVRCEPVQPLNLGREALSAERGGELPLVLHLPDRAGDRVQLLVRVAGVAPARPGLVRAPSAWAPVELPHELCLDEDGRVEARVDVPAGALRGLDGHGLEWSALLIGPSGSARLDPVRVDVLP